MSEQTNIPSTAGAPGGEAAARVREKALAAKRLAAAAQRLVPAHGTDAQRSAVQDAQVASIMADEAMAAVSDDEALAVAMAEEASTLAIESLKAAQAAAPGPAHAAPVPAHAAPEAEPVPVVPAAQNASGEAASARGALREDLARSVPAIPVPEPAPASPTSAVAPAPAVTDAPAAPAAAAAQDVSRETPACPAAPLPAASVAAPAQAATGMPVIPAKRSHKFRTACIALSGVLLVMTGLVAGAWFGLFRLPEPVQERIYLLPDAHAQAGTLNAADIDVAPGSFQMVLNQLCTMAEGSLNCPIQFENPAANQYSARVVLEVDGEELARSGMVAPGSYVPAVRLDRALEPGDHEMRAVVLVYSGATQVNTLASDVTVRVK